jgi:anti-sigma B factor antagonist
MSAPQREATSRTAGAPVSAVVLGDHGEAWSTITRRTERPAGGPALLVVAVADDLDQDSAPLLRATLTDALEPGREVCCDVGAVTFLGAAGASTMLEANQLAVARGAGFTVRGARGLTREILEFVGLGKVLRPGV